MEVGSSTLPGTTAKEIGKRERRGISSVGLEHLPCTQGVKGSSPLFSTVFFWGSKKRRQEREIIDILDKKKRIQSKQESYYRDMITKEKKEAKKGRRWMPRLSEAKKDVISCEKLRGLANTNRSVDIRMGEPV